METTGSDYREGFTDLTYREFVKEFADKLIANYIRREHEDILQESEFFDFVSSEYRENRLVDFNEDDYNLEEEDDSNEQIW